MTQELLDHIPIIFNFPHLPKPRTTFLFCDIWTKDKGLKDIVKHRPILNHIWKHFNRFCAAWNIPSNSWTEVNMLTFMHSKLKQEQTLYRYKPFCSKTLLRQCFFRTNHIVENILFQSTTQLSLSLNNRAKLNGLGLEMNAQECLWLELNKERQWQAHSI